MCKDLLLARAKTSLFNSNEVTPELCEVACVEAKELTDNKPIKTTMLIDLAIVRLKLHLKVEVDPIEEKLAMNAIKESKLIPATESTGAEIKKSTIKTGIRTSEWDM